MAEHLDEVTPFPAYIDSFEKFVGLPMYADAELEARVRDDPESVERSGFELRHGLYMLVQQAIAGAAGVTDISELGLGSAWQYVHDHELAVRQSHRRLISEIRGELMEADEGLKTPAVLELEVALASLRPKPDRVRRPRVHESHDLRVLPAYMTTIRSIGRVLDMTRTDAHAALRQRHIVSPRLRLPGPPGIPEQVVPWPAVEHLGTQFGYVPGVAIDFTTLPQNRFDKDPDRTDNARQLQRQIVPLYKLVNIPDVVHPDELDDMKKVARPFELSMSQLERLMGGGFHYLEDYIAKQGLLLACHLHPKTNIVGEFLTKETAADIWQQYAAIPWATDEHTPIARIAENAGVERGNIVAGLRPGERASVTLLRSQFPAGRAIQHLPNDLARNLEERFTRAPLPPNRVQVNRLSTYIQGGYSAIMKRIADMPVFVPKLLMPGKKRKQACCDWRTVRCLELLMGRRTDTVPIQYDQLPVNATDQHPQRVVYAQQVQASLGLSDMIVGEPRIPQEYPTFNELGVAVQREISGLMQNTGFTSDAVIRLLTERDIVLRPGVLDKGLQCLIDLAAPPAHSTIASVTEELGSDVHDALDFLRKYRGRYGVWLDRDGYPDVYVDYLSEEMLYRQKYPAGLSHPDKDVDVAPSNWVHLGQILPTVNATLDDFFRWIGEHLPGQDLVWLHAGANGPVLPHYVFSDVAPFIRAFRRKDIGGRLSTSGAKT